MRRACWCSFVVLGACGPPAAEPPTDEVPPDPVDTTVPVGRAHRLTRSHLDRAVSDLLGLDAELRFWLPDDPQTAGFDNNEAGLYLSPTFVRTFDDALRRALDKATATPAPWSWSAERLGTLCLTLSDCTVTQLEPASGGAPAQVSLTAQPLEVRFHVPEPGRYRFRFGIAPTLAGWPDITVDGQAVLTDNEVVPGEELVFEAPALEAGHHVLQVERITFSTSGLTISPLVPTPPRAAFAELFPCVPSTEAPSDDWTACATSILGPWVRRAWRRAPAEDELAGLLRIMREGRADGEDFPTALGRALHAALLSPWFLFRVEPPTEGELEGYAIASRLAFLAWSAPPDDALLDEAEAGSLATPEGRSRALARLLADPRREGLVKDFAGQWLGLRTLDQLQPDPTAYPQFNAALRAAMRSEVELLFAALLTGERTLPAFVHSGTGEVPDPLHTLYGLPKPGWHEDLDAVGRGGVLRAAGWLATSSRPNRTSVVHRGLGVLRALLCETTGDPPAFMSPPTTDAAAPGEVSARAANKSCAQCHARIDPPGALLEGFDVIGGRRATYAGGEALPGAITLEDGTVAAGADDLAAWVAADPRLSSCLTRQALTWAHGLPADPDSDVYASALAALEASGGDMPSMLDAIVRHESYARPLRRQP